MARLPQDFRHASRAGREIRGFKRNAARFQGQSVYYSVFVGECGFDPANEAFEITADFDGDGTVETLPNTYDGWQKSIAAGGVYATAGNNVKLEVLSALEYNLLKNFRTLPLCVIADVTLRSKKVNYATENANIFVAYGGVRLMTYKYSDAEWAEFCKNSNNLKYD